MNKNLLAIALAAGIAVVCGSASACGCACVSCGCAPCGGGGWYYYGDTGVYIPPGPYYNGGPYTGYYAPYDPERCAWIDGRYNYYGYWVPAHRVCWYSGIDSGTDYSGLDP